MTPWDEYLSVLELNVEDAWRLLTSRGDGSDDAPWGADSGPTAPAEPCPDALRPRAVEVLRQIHEVEAAIINRQQEVARDLKRRPVAPTPRDRVGWSLSIEM